MRTAEESKIEQIRDIRRPSILIDESLDKYDNVILFPEKLVAANESIRKAGHPEDALKRLIKSGKIRE